MISASSECSSKGHTTSFPVINYCTSGYSELWLQHIRELVNYLFFLNSFSTFHDRKGSFRDERDSSEGPIFEEYWERSFCHVRSEDVPVIFDVLWNKKSGNDFGLASTSTLTDVWSQQYLPFLSVLFVWTNHFLLSPQMWMLAKGITSILSIPWTVKRKEV